MASSAVSEVLERLARQVDPWSPGFSRDLMVGMLNPLAATAIIATAVALSFTQSLGLEAEMLYAIVWRGVEEEVYSKDQVIVAVQQGNILAAAFHPELTSDSRWHRLFLDMDKESQAKAFAALSLSTSSRDGEDGSKNKPL